jgi:hypothetical protein
MRAESRISSALGIGFGAIGGLLAALLVRKEIGEKALERGSSLITSRSKGRGSERVFC